MIIELIRWPLGQLILLIDWLTAPRPPQRDPRQQAIVDRATDGLALYQFKACPYCVKTRRAMRRLGVTIETREARREPRWREELLRGGGRVQVPCLRIPDTTGAARWLYESDDIIAFLEQRCAGETASPEA
jgi:glutaredoxin